MERKQIASKPVGKEHLVIETLTSGHDFPGQTVHVMGLTREPTGEGSRSAFLTSPGSYMLSETAYRRIFEMIESRDDFNRLSDGLRGKMAEAYDLIRV